MGPFLWLLHLTCYCVFLLSDCGENWSGSRSFLALHCGDDMENVILAGMHGEHDRLDSAVSCQLLQCLHHVSVPACFRQQRMPERMQSRTRMKVCKSPRCPLG